MVIFPDATIIPDKVFLQGRKLLHLDNPDPDQSETISKPFTIRKYPIIWPD